MGRILSIHLGGQGTIQGLRPCGGPNFIQPPHPWKYPSMGWGGGYKRGGGIEFLPLGGFEKPPPSRSKMPSGQNGGEGGGRIQFLPGPQQSEANHQKILYKGNPLHPKDSMASLRRQPLLLTEGRCRTGYRPKSVLRSSVSLWQKRQGKQTRGREADQLKKPETCKCDL